jgi:hypothetical protein
VIVHSDKVHELVDASADVVNDTDRAHVRGTGSG